MDSKSSNMSIAVFIGTLWGFLEASLGGLLHHMHSPITGRIMAPIGFALLYWGMKNGLKPRHLAFTACITASFKFFDVLLFSMPINSIRIINPALAILSQGLAFSIAAKVLQNKVTKFAHILCYSITSIAIFITFFNLSSYIIFGQNSTIYFENPIRAFLINTPIALIFTTLLFFIVDCKVCTLQFVSIERRGFIPISAVSVILAIAAITIRSILA